MVFLIAEKGNFLNAERAVKEKLAGKTATILDAGTIETIKREGEKEKTVCNFKIEVDGAEMIYTPNATNRDIWEEAWGEEQEVDGEMVKGLDTEKLVGNQFIIRLTKVNFRGKIVDSILTEPMRTAGKVVNGKAVKSVKV